MNENTKANIYVFSNILAWILLSAIAVLIIFHFIEGLALRIILSIVAIIGLAYFEERIFCRIVGRIVAFFLHDK